MAPSGGGRRGEVSRPQPGRTVSEEGELDERVGVLAGEEGFGVGQSQGVHVDLRFPFEGPTQAREGVCGEEEDGLGVSSSGSGASQL